MYNPFNRNSAQQQKNIQPKMKEGCRIKVKYDQHGRIKELQDNGQCSKQDREAFMANAGIKTGNSKDEDFDE